MAEQNLPGEYQNQYKFNVKEQDIEMRSILKLN